MTSPVVTVAPETSVREIARLLAARRISGVPVLEDGRLVGLVSEADLLRRRRGAPARCARDVMSPAVEAVGPDTPVVKVAALLEDRGIKRVPVLQDGRVVGIVSRSNLVQALALQEAAAAPRSPDDEIRGALLEQLARAPGWHPAEANAIVRDGVVHYWGAVDSEARRDAARAIAETIPGVRGVEDHRFLRQPRAAAPRGANALRRAAERGHSQHGRITLSYSFPFGDYYDPARLAFGPLVALNEVSVHPGAGPVTYGLRDVEILLYVLSGELDYEDSLDNAARLVRGDVRHISAGSGMRQHASNASGSAPVHLLQAWIDPDSVGVPPASEQARFEAGEKRGRLCLIASPDARERSLALRQDVLVYAGIFDGAERARLAIAPGRAAYVHVARGRIEVNGQALGEGDALFADAGEVQLATGEGAEVLAFDLPA